MSVKNTQWLGVNLGGWLVLEKWITPSLFTGIDTQDEYGLSEVLGNRASEIFKIHRENFITEEDFIWLASKGINAVRVPIGFWVFGHAKPYVGCIEYLDRALIWAEKHNIKVIIDVHAAPGSQNGQDHSGRIGKINWPLPDNIELTLSLLTKLAERYQGVNSFVGIELLNEPSSKIARNILLNYYKAGYAVIRRIMGPDVAIIISDGFHPRSWKMELTGSKYQNVILDTHQYQIFKTFDKFRSHRGHIHKAMNSRRRLLASLNADRQIIVGEWSLTLPPRSFKGLTRAQNNSALRAYGSVQMLVQQECRGSFYWTYKTELGGAWSFRESVKSGLLPARFN